MGGIVASADAARPLPRYPDSLRRVATVAHPRLAPDEFVALESSVGWQLALELIHGEAVVIPPTGGYAASIQGELFFALRTWQERVGDRGLLLQDVFVALPGGHFLAPDIAWWHDERRPRVGDGAVDVVPDLVVEVLSPATRLNDLGAKRELYVTAGVRELWLADPTDASIIRVTAEATGGDARTHGTFAGGLLDRLEIDLTRVFAR